MRTSSVRRFFGVADGVGVSGLLAERGSGLDCGTECTEEGVWHSDSARTGNGLEAASSLLVLAKKLSKNMGDSLG